MFGVDVKIYNVGRLGFFVHVNLLLIFLPDWIFILLILQLSDFQDNHQNVDYSFHRIDWVFGSLFY